MLGLTENQLDFKMWNWIVMS